MPFNIYSELSSSILAFMLIALTHSSAWVGEHKGATIVNDRCPHSDGNEHIRAIECTTALLNPQLQSLAAVWCDTGPRARPHAHAHSQRTGRSICPRGQIFALTLSGTSATSLRGCEFGLLTGSKLGLAWAMQLYIEDIVIGIKRPGHCMKHEAVCCGLHKSNRVPNVVALTTLPRFLIRWKSWGTPVQRNRFSAILPRCTMYGWSTTFYKHARCSLICTIHAYGARLAAVNNSVLLSKDRCYLKNVWIYYLWQNN